jgi:hypothetical protein
MLPASADVHGSGCRRSVVDNEGCIEEVQLAHGRRCTLFWLDFLEDLVEGRLAMQAQAMSMRAPLCSLLFIQRAATDLPSCLLKAYQQQQLTGRRIPKSLCSTSSVLVSSASFWGTDECGRSRKAFGDCHRHA